MKTRTIKLNTARQWRRNSTNPATSMRSSFLILLLLACIGVASKVEAVSPPPDGGYPGGNTAEGQAALFSLTTGTGNTATGFKALFRNTTGFSNTATGNGALFSNTTGEGNTAIGQAALSINTTGVANVAVGAGALNANINGLSNTAVTDADIVCGALNPDYIASTVRLKDGRVFNGIVRDAGADRFIVRGDADGEIEPIHREEVSQIIPSAVSTMPQGLEQGLGKDRTRDLMTFLLSRPLEPMPTERPDLPPPRTRAKVNEVLTPAPTEKTSAPISNPWCSSPPTSPRPRPSRPGCRRGRRCSRSCSPAVNSRPTRCSSSIGW